VIPSWGCDGWDLGQWPYVMVAGIRTADASATCSAWPPTARATFERPSIRTKARFWTAISEQAFFHWKNGQAHGPEDLPEAAAELPSRYRMPCTLTDAA
jgi:hypothetical protein